MCGASSPRISRSWSGAAEMRWSICVWSIFLIKVMFPQAARFSQKKRPRGIPSTTGKRKRARLAPCPLIIPIRGWSNLFLRNYLMGQAAPSVRVPPGATVPVDRAPENTGVGVGTGADSGVGSGAGAGAGSKVMVPSGAKINARRGT